MNIDLPTGYTSITIKELARLQAIEKAAEMMATRLSTYKNLNVVVATFNRHDEAALAEYEKAKAGISDVGDE